GGRYLWGDHLEDAGQRDVERRAATGSLARRPDATTVRLHDLAAHREAEALAGDLGVLRRAEAWREDALEVVGRDARALIADRDVHFTVRGDDLEDDRRAIGRVLRGVPEEIVEHLAQAHRVDPRDHLRPRVDELDVAPRDRAC